MRLPQDTIFHYRSEDGITIKVDAIPLVRCGECKWWDTEFDDEGFGWCDHIERTTGKGWFCADGEKRDENRSG